MALIADWKGRIPQPRVRDGHERVSTGWRPYEQHDDRGVRTDDPRLVSAAEAEGLLFVELASDLLPDERVLWVVDVSGPIDDERILFSALWGRLTRVISEGWQESRTVRVAPGIRVLRE